MASLSFCRPRFNADTHVISLPSSTTDFVPCDRLLQKAYCEVLATRPVENTRQWTKTKCSPNADWIEIVRAEGPACLRRKSGLRESVLVNCLLVCMILLKLQTLTRPVLSGCEMTRFCYITRSVIHYVHDHDFGTPWLLYVSREQLHFFRSILTTFY